MSTLLELRGVETGYHGVPVVHDLDLTVGDFAAIVAATSIAASRSSARGTTRNTLP